MKLLVLDTNEFPDGIPEELIDLYGEHSHWITDTPHPEGVGITGNGVYYRNKPQDLSQPDDGIDLQCKYSGHTRPKPIFPVGYEIEAHHWYNTNKETWPSLFEHSSSAIEAITNGWCKRDKDISENSDDFTEEALRRGWLMSAPKDITKENLAKMAETRKTLIANMLSARRSISDCLDEFTVPEGTPNSDELVTTTPRGITRGLKMLDEKFASDELEYVIGEVPEGFVSTVDDFRIRAPRPEQTPALKDKIRQAERLFASLKVAPGSEVVMISESINREIDNHIVTPHGKSSGETMQVMKSRERLDCLVPQRKEELIALSPETTLDAALKKRVLIMGNYPIPNADVSSMYLNPVDEIILDEDYGAASALADQLKTNIENKTVTIKPSPHKRDIKVIGCLIYANNTEVKWVRKSLCDFLNSGPSTHAILKDRKNIFHVTPNEDGTITLLHMLYQWGEWWLQNYALIDLSDYEVRDV